MLIFCTVGSNFALKVYLKTKRTTDISQTQAECKAKSHRNPLRIPRLFNAKSRCACRNRRYFRRFRYTLWIFWVKHAAGCRCSQSPAAFCAAVHCLFCSQTAAASQSKSAHILSPLESPCILCSLLRYFHILSKKLQKTC